MLTDSKKVKTQVEKVSLVPKALKNKDFTTAVKPILVRSSNGCRIVNQIRGGYRCRKAMKYEAFSATEKPILR